MRAIATLPEPVQAAVTLVKAHTTGGHAELAGSIIPNWLPAAMPPYGKRSSKMDKLALLLMVEIIAAYRVKGDVVFFRGFAYQINRSDLASRWDCKTSDISFALTFLVKEGLVQRTHRTHIGTDGEHAGKAAFVIPVVEKVVDRIKQAKCRSEASGLFFSGTSASPSSPPTTTVSGTSLVAEAHLSPNSAEVAVKADETNGGAAHGATRRPASASTACTGSKSSSASEGPPLVSSALAAPEARPCKSKSSSDSPAATGQPRLNGTHAKTPQGSADQFIALWTEGIQRVGIISPYKPSVGDRRAALKFFSENSAPGIFRLFLFASQAWRLPAFDPKAERTDRYYYCRKALGISGFFHNLTQIQRELFSAGLKITPQLLYITLRKLFLDQELTAMGFLDFALLNIERPVPAKLLWEHADPEMFRDYYTSIKRPVPVVASAGLHAPEDSSNPPLGSNDSNPPLGSNDDDHAPCDSATP